LSSTSDYAPNTNQLLTNYSFRTRSLALSLALFRPLFRQKRTVDSGWLPSSGIASIENQMVA